MRDGYESRVSKIGAIVFCMHGGRHLPGRRGRSTSGTVPAIASREIAPLEVSFLNMVKD